MNESESDRLICKTGDIINKHYRIVGRCNPGTFSNVYECIDTLNQNPVIIKVYRSSNYYKRSAAKEIQLLQFLNKIDREQNLFVSFLGDFDYDGHTCIILEKFGPTLYDAIASQGFKPINLYAIRSILYNICCGLKELHHSGFIHTDLKTENIVLPNHFDAKNDFDRPFTSPPQSSSDNDDCQIEISYPNNSRKSQINARLIDFDSLKQGFKWHRSLATTCEYRAPEILLGLQWGTECDMWSLGCILVELATGTIEFASTNDLEHLLLIQHMIAPIPGKMLKATTKQEVSAFVCGNLIDPNCLGPQIKDDILQKPTLWELLSFDEELNNLAQKLLNPDPSERINIDQVLNHPFFQLIANS